MVSIDYFLCKACGICGDVCPRHILETTEKYNYMRNEISLEREYLCLSCGHCAAVCPEGAITIDDVKLDFQKISNPGITDEKLIALLSQRRSVRRYKNKPVPRDILNRILEAVKYAPTGTGSGSTGITVIDSPEVLSKLSAIVYKEYELLDRALKNPVTRWFIKRKRGQNKLNTLQNFVMPGMQWYMKWYREGMSNEILRDCPVLILIHSPVDEPVGAENCLIAAFHAVLMAHVLNIGTCFNDLVPPMCNRNEEIRDLINLPENREIYSALTLGFPKYKFRQSISRDLAEVHYL